jgi:hypothetical protein
MNDIALPTEHQARALTDRIRIAVEGTWQLIQEAYTSRAWAVLGYDTWDAYCTAEFGKTRLRLPREERQEVVASLRDSGLSTRAIASATALSEATVRRDLSGASSDAPDAQSVIGTDGRVYSKSRPSVTEPAPDGDLLAGDDWVQSEGPGFEDAVTPPPGTPCAPVQAKRRPLPEAFTDAGRDLTRAAERLARLTEDDRFAKNRENTHHQVPELLGALDHTARLIQAMRLETAEVGEEARRWWATSLNTISDALRGAAHSIEQEL